MSIEDDFFRPFPSLSDIAQIGNIAKYIKTFGLTLEEVSEMCNRRMDEVMSRSGKFVTKEETKNERKKKLVCPECGKNMIAKRVNISKCTNIGGPWKSSLECTNKNCRHTELSTKRPEELL